MLHGGVRGADQRRTLNVTNDKTSTCADGFQYDVRITTNAPAGTDVSLYNSNALLRTVQVASGSGRRSPTCSSQSTGMSALSIQFPSTATCTDPTTKSTVTVSCPSTAPTCTISAPTISPTHPALNGVLAPSGDRASQIGSPYQVTFNVTTSAEDGQPVTLTYDPTGSTTPTTLNGTATGGVATFGVPLSPDGTFDVRATCRNMAGITGMSMLTSYPVDTTAPNLSVSQPTDGQFFAPRAHERHVQRLRTDDVCRRRRPPRVARRGGQQPVRGAGRIRRPVSAPPRSRRSTPTRASPSPAPVALRSTST